jgi:hypothetical protein
VPQESEESWWLMELPGELVVHGPTAQAIVLLLRSYLRTRDGERPGEG